jgi:hypothetical protein
MIGTTLTDPATQINATRSISSDLLCRAKMKNYREHFARKMIKVSTMWTSDFLELKPSSCKQFKNC